MKKYFFALSLLLALPDMAMASTALSSAGTDISSDTVNTAYNQTNAEVCPVTPWVTDADRYGHNITVGDEFVYPDTGLKIKVTQVTSDNKMSAYDVEGPGYSDKSFLNAPEWSRVVQAASSSVNAPCLQISSEAIIARTAQSVMQDTYNLKNFGLSLDNSQSDKENMETVLNSLGENAVVYIPKGSNWDGLLPDNPQKKLTYIWGARQTGDYPPIPGDGDTSVMLSNGVSIEYQNKKTSFTYPFTSFYWNKNQNFTGPWSSNYQQYASGLFRAISGPTSTGNTSPIQATLSSYGNNPSGSYDVGLSLNAQKYGQNSMWGLVIDLNDFSPKSAGAFASWNEYDLWAYGQDIKDWSPDYGNPQGGHRSLFYVNGHYLSPGGWSANKQITVSGTGQDDLPEPVVIGVTASDGTDYVWYATQSGTTGSQEPVFPVPAKILGSISGDTLTVTKVSSGSLSVGDSITGASPVNVVHIVSQLSGTTGGTGTYKLDSNTESAAANEPMYSVPVVKDGTVAWQFGQEKASTISSGMFWTGDAFDFISAIASDTKITQAVLDTSVAQFGQDADVIRMAPGQRLDFSAQGTLATANRHTLSYEASDSALEYKVGGQPVVKVEDDHTFTVNDGNLFINNGNSLVLQNKGGYTNVFLYVDSEGNLTYLGGIGTFKGSIVNTTAAPSSSQASCKAGQFADDASYHYACIADNRWKRVGWNSDSW
ncbi:hypothetical protein [Acetobacter persici]|uniref:hypothetical protein n=1 Tax=Acetobacter persici TaxID=1076596 RepID=UPI0039ECE855